MEKRLRYAKLHKTQTEISSNRFYGVMNPNVKILVHHQYAQRKSGQRYNSECLQSTLKHGGAVLKQCGLILTGNQSQHSKKSFQEAWRSTPEDYLKKQQDSFH